jgi:methyl-accepting chemotaxis protein
MITICEECGKKYKIDPAKITGTEAKFKCKACGHLITASKPPPPIEAKKDDQPIPSISPEANAQKVAEEKSATAPPAVEKPDKQEKRPVSTRPAKISLGLTAKLFMMMIIVSLVPLSMFWGITLEQTKNRMRYDTKRHIDQISISIAGHVEEWVDRNVRILKTFASMEDVMSMDRLKQEALLETIRKVYPWIYLTYTIDADGKNIARNDGRPLINYSNKQYFKDVMEGKATAWQTLVDEQSKKPTLILAVPIVQYNEIVGVIANAINLDYLSKRVLTWEGGETGFAFMVDAKGKVVAHKNRRYLLQQQKLSHHPLIAAFQKGQRGSASFSNQDGKSILGHVRGTALGWIIAIQQEEKEAFYLIEQLMSYTYLLLAVTVIFVFIIAWFFGRALSRPIIRLTDAADRISVGELEVKIDTSRKDEIGDLAMAIARMQDSIRLSIERLRQRR